MFVWIEIWVLMVPNPYVDSMEQVFNGNNLESRTLAVQSIILEDDVFLSRSKASLK